MLYFDESYNDQYFYVSLVKNLSQLEKLDEFLQNDIIDENININNQRIRMVKSINELKIGDKLEALYESDSKWYRVSIIDIQSDSVSFYFLDFGNTEKIKANQVPKMLRIRNFYKNIEEENIFQMEYQAIKCLYSLNNKSTLVDFLDKLETIQNMENGFDIKVKQVTSGEQKHYNIIFASDSIIDTKNPTSLSTIIGN